jgi:hypothetical protein
MIKNLAIGPLGPCRNGQNFIDEGLLSVGGICYITVYLLHRLLHREHFHDLYPRELIIVAMCLLRLRHLFHCIEPLLINLSFLISSVHVRRTQHYRNVCRISSNQTYG